MDTLEKKTTLKQMESDFSQSLGSEKAQEVIEKAALAAGLPIKEEYSSGEAIKILEVIEKEQKGYARTLAELCMARIIVETGDMRKISKLINELQSAKTSIQVWSATLEYKVKARTKELIQSQEALVKAKNELEDKVRIRTSDLEATARNLRTALQAKAEFLANMSHELRTPLNSIIGFSEVLQAETFGALNEKQKSYVSYVLTSGQHLLTLINDVLSLSSTEAGSAKLFFTEFSVKNKIEALSQLFKAQADEKKIKISIDMPKDVGNIEADAQKFKEIIYNLLSNAIKFTPEGGEVGVKVLRHTEEIEVDVWDTGVGIAAENLQKMFSVFTRIESSLSKATEGTGLGLVYTKRLVEMHGGNIWIKSAGLGKGTQTVFTLPIKQKKEHVHDKKNTDS